MSKFTLVDLEQRVSDRAKASSEQSYTRQLLDKGVAQCAKKFGEEAVELVIAAVEGEKPAAVAEAADVVYHLLVLLRSLGIPLSEVLVELQRRTAQSGHAEKESRSA